MVVEKQAYLAMVGSCNDQKSEKCGKVGCVKSGRLFASDWIGSILGTNMYSEPTRDSNQTLHPVE